MYIDQVGLRLFRFCPIYVLGLNMISPRQRHTRFNLEKARAKKTMRR